MLHLVNFFSLGVALLFLPPILCQESPPQGVPIHLEVRAGTPLRLYITKRVSYRLGEPVQGKFAEPVWAFDRIVIPAGTVVHGQVTELNPAPGMERAMSIVRGDFTPLKRAQVSFTNLILPDGKRFQLDVQQSLGLGSIFVPPPPPKNGATNKKPHNPNSKSAQISRFLKKQAEAQANSRSRGLFDGVRAKNKKEWLEDWLWAKLPYHPQYYRTGMRFDAVLKEPLDFGDTTMSDADLRGLGVEAPADTPVVMRLLTTVSSADAHVGDPLNGVLTQPLYSRDHRLALPEGTQLTGKITLAHHARMLHRGGQLRFTFDNVKVPTIASAPAPVPEERTQAQLTAAEPTSGPLKVDPEGTAKATEPKTRLLRPVIAGLVAAKSLDNDAGKTSSGGANANYSGRGLGGFSGFGLLGTFAMYGPKPLGTALGFYGLAWSVYSTVISRGRDVVFEKNSAMSIRFGPPPRSH
jgi:hypothetical protein